MGEKVRLKCHLREEIQILNVPASIQPTELLQKLSKSFRTTVRVKQYQDHEGDNITVTSLEEDLEEAFSTYLKFKKLKPDQIHTLRLFLENEVEERISSRVGEQVKAARSIKKDSPAEEEHEEELPQSSLQVKKGTELFAKERGNDRELERRGFEVEDEDDFVNFRSDMSPNDSDTSVSSCLGTSPGGEVNSNSSDIQLGRSRSGSSPRQKISILFERQSPQAPTGSFQFTHTSHNSNSIIYPKNASSTSSSAISNQPTSSSATTITRRRGQSLPERPKFPLAPFRKSQPSSKTKSGIIMVHQSASQPVLPILLGTEPLPQVQHQLQETPQGARRSKFDLYPSSSSSAITSGAASRAMSPSSSATEDEFFNFQQRSEEEEEREENKEICYQVGQLIGKGAFARVYLGLRDTGEMIAIKQVDLPTDSNEYLTKLLVSFEREIEVMKNFTHPNIVRYLGINRDDLHLNIFLEYVPCGSIQSLYSKFGPLSESIIKNYIKQILSGLQFLHRNSVIHRDIKGANILIDNRGVAKLADFGCSRMLNDVAMTQKCVSFLGTPFWMAPEMIRQTGHGITADIWSLGCTIIEMATSKPPWVDQVAKEPAAIMYHIASTNSTPDIPTSLSPDAHEFLSCCLRRNPDERPSASDLLLHRFIRNNTDGDGHLPQIKIALSKIPQPSFQYQHTQLSFLPRKILVSIFSFLKVSDLLSVSRVCSFWRRLVNQKAIWKKHTTDLWRKMVVMGSPSELNSHLLSSVVDMDLHNHPISGTGEKGWRNLYLNSKRDIRLFSKISNSEVLKGHSKRINCVVFCDAPQNEHVYGASAGDEEKIKIWDIKSLSPVKSLKGHKNKISSLATSPNMLYSASHDRTIKIWDLTSFECKLTLQGLLSPVTAIRMGSNQHDNKLFSSCWDGVCKLWDVEKGRMISTFSIKNKKKMYAFGVGIRKCTSMSLDDRKGGLLGSGISLSGGHGYFSSGGNNISNNVDLSSTTLLNNHSNGGNISPGRDCDTSDKKAQSLMNAVTSNSTSPCARTVTVDFQDNMVVSGSEDGMVRIWDVRDFSASPRVLNHGRPSSPRKIYPVNHVRMCKDLNTVISCGGDRSLWVMDISYGSIVHQLDGHKDEVTSFYLDSHKLVSASKDKTVKLWDLTTCRSVKTWSGHTGEIYSVDVFKGAHGIHGIHGDKIHGLRTDEDDGDSDNDLFPALLTGSRDKQIRVWRPASHLQDKKKRRTSDL
eukprot:TRINITY_DN3081_c0_g1_i1.p1 TRINITY_DN3081_c0_g1~~TRINITY_DN3081_c0_g1_i1.p1  ORF type:complete len:1240 (+),score=254.36 TRINITY_DN3081_c0_g1_i1:49-3720(+)